MNNRQFVFKSLFLTKIIVFLTKGKNIKQGPYNVIDLINRFSPLSYTKKEFKKELVSVVYNYAKYGFHVDEYFIYDVKSMSDFGKSKFITEETRWKYYEKLNDESNQRIFDEKDLTYLTFKKYYNRECIVVKSSEDYGIFDDFISKYQKIIIKPKNSSGGKGVRLYNRSEDSFEKLLLEYKDGFVAEEVLDNAPEMAEFHSQSLNTVRVVSVRMNDRIEIACAFARFGTGGKSVDNFASNGIMGVIDVDTGIIYSAINKRGERFIIHPDSKKTIIGFKLPKWEELVKLVNELACVIPTNRYSGWDLAYTTKGWTVIEVNARGQFVAQMPSKEGLKEKFDKYLAEI